MPNDDRYIEKYVSANASDNFTKKNSLNELIADDKVLIENGKNKDEYLADLIRGVINYDGASK